MIKSHKLLFLCFALLVLSLPALGFAQTNDTAALTMPNEVIPIQHYTIQFHYDSTADKADLTAITLQNGPAAMVQEPTGGWYYDVVNAAGEILDHHFFEVPLTCAKINAADPNSGITCTENNQFDATIEIAYNPLAKNINFYNPEGKMVLFVDLTKFSQDCGNGVCDSNENYNTCPQDCRSGIKDGYCDGVADGVCDPDCQQDEDADCVKLAASAPTQTGKFNTTKIIIWSVVIIIIIVIISFIIIKKKKHNSINNANNSGN